MNELLLRRRAMLLSGKKFPAPIVGTKIILNTPGVYYVTPIDSGNKASGWNVLSFYKDSFNKSLMSAKTVSAHFPKLCKITIDAEKIELLYPYKSQWSPEERHIFEGATDIDFCSGWSGAYGDNPTTFRVDYDESKWGVGGIDANGGPI